MKGWLLVVVIVLAVLLAAGFGVYLRNNTANLQIKKIENNLYLPNELLINFNPSVDIPVFAIESVDRLKNTLYLRFVFPEIRNKENVISLISCENVLVDGVKLSLDEGMEKISKTYTKQTVFRGLCTDQSCSEINSACEFIVPKVVRNVP